MSGNPFRTLGTERIYDNPWIRVTESRVVRPDGKRGIYGVVHFKARAVGVIPYENGKIWLVGQYRYPLDIYSWEIPEGGTKAGESLLAAARRELAEETGLRARRYQPLVKMHLSNSITDEFGIVYLATGLTRGRARPEGTEKLRIKQVSLQHAYSQVIAGKITDSLSVAGLLRLWTIEHPVDPMGTD
jgi:8-oxo-dGTP pyrophosphatase MutT (NUDIX family)